MLDTQEQIIASILKDETFQKVLQNVPEEERKQVIGQLRESIVNFLIPLLGQIDEVLKSEEQKKAFIELFQNTWIG